MAECDVCLQSFDQWFKVSGYGCCSGLFCVNCKKDLKRCPYCRSEIAEEREITDILSEKQKKYNSLVWFARSHPMDDDEYWENESEDTKQRVMASQNRVIEEYAAEVQALQSCDDNWQHGFNSGMLAALRYVQTLLGEDEEGEDEEGMEGIDWFMEAEREFPALYT